MQIGIFNLGMSINVGEGKLTVQTFYMNVSGNSFKHQSWETPHMYIRLTHIGWMHPPLPQIRVSLLKKSEFLNIWHSCLHTAASFSWNVFWLLFYLLEKLFTQSKMAKYIIWQNWLVTVLKWHQIHIYNDLFHYAVKSAVYVFPNLFVWIPTQNMMDAFYHPQIIPLS